MAASRIQPTPISILLRLYPRSWRARYADELVALLADTGLTPTIVLDVVLGALDARWSGDYPDNAGEDRKVRRPMVDRLAALLTAAGGAFFTILMVLAMSAPPPETSTLYTAWLLGIPVAMAALALGIAGLSLGWLRDDPIERMLGLATSGFAGGILIAILFLFFVGDAGYDAAMFVFPGFAVATGLVGLRIALSRRDRLPGGVLLAAGAIATSTWVGAVLTNGSPEVTALSFGIVTVAWGLVGLARLRSGSPIAATA
jgi:hypothetical protein